MAALGPIEKIKVEAFTHPASAEADPPLSRGDFVMFIILIYLFLLASILKSSTSLNSTLPLKILLILLLYFFINPIP